MFELPAILAFPRPDLADSSTASIAGSTAVTDTELWLFAVDDGGAELVASCEFDGQVHVRRLDPTNPNASSWIRLGIVPADYPLF